MAKISSVVSVLSLLQILEFRKREKSFLAKNFLKNSRLLNVNDDDKFHLITFLQVNLFDQFDGPSVDLTRVGTLGRPERRMR